jgi:CheY-like chemotaxis protein
VQDKGSGTILIVDDDPDFVDITTRILSTHGYSVLSAANGAEALSLMRQRKPDLVLLDIMMTTVLDGLSAGEEMQSDPELKDIPVIMISSIADTEYAAVFPSDSYLPMDEWISKPVRPEELLKKVRRHLP